MRHIQPLTERVDTRQRCQMLDVTHLIARAISEHKVRSGLAIVHVPHTTPCVALLPAYADSAQASGFGTLKENDRVFR